MFALFRALIDRFKAVFATNAALELESEFLARDAERRAELLRQADHYDDEGLHGIAQHLRQRAEELSVQRPLASVLPALEHLLGPDATKAIPLLQAPTGKGSTNSKQLALTKIKKKGR